MKLIKAITHLKRKFTQPKFFVNDYDQECLNTVIDFYNITEKEITLNYRNYNLLVILIFQYELINAKLNKRNVKLSDIRDHIMHIITRGDNERHLVEVLNEANTAKTKAKIPDIETLSIDDIDDPIKFMNDCFLNQDEESKIIKFIETITAQIVLNESHKNK